ncbi:MAG: SusC/RagA family TonB-linked outer membrane protein [Bacteroidota bacterium]
MKNRYDMWIALLQKREFPFRYILAGFCTALILMVGIVPAQAQDSETVQGQVVDSQSGDPLPGVNVIIEGTTQGTSTDENGEYELDVPSLQETLVFSFVGYQSQEIEINGETTIDVNMNPEAVSGDEVVVVGYGEQARGDITSSISTVDIDKTIGSRPVSDLGSGLQGAVSSLTISTPTGEIGSTPDINLRGLQGSLNSSGANPLILVDGVEVDNINQINPSEVENISVLKDAASTAIYGSRAAWGAILIETKYGDKERSPQVNYSNSFSASTPTTDLNVAPAPEGAEMAFSAMQRSSPSTNEFCIVGVCIDQEGIDKMYEWREQYGDQDLSNEMEMGRDFEIRDGGFHFYRPWDAADMFMDDWQPMQKHDLSVSGGDENTSYNVGLGYLGQDGVMTANPDEWERYNVDIGVESTINSWLETRGKLTFSQTSHIQANTPFTGGTYDNWYYLYRWPKTYPYGTYDGRPFRSSVTDLQQANDREDQTDRTRISLGATLNLAENLSLETDYTYNNNENQERQVGGSVEGYNFWAGGGDLNYGTYTTDAFNQINQSSSWDRRDNLRAVLNYDLEVEDHSVTLLTGSEAEYYRDNYQYSERRNLLDADNRPEFSLATGDEYVGGASNHWATLGFFGRVNYDFDDKYLLQVNGRFDGSSRFPTDQKWGFFPSVSVGYRISEEPFMAFAEDYLTSLKLRSSYGSVGNSAVGEYPFISTMGNEGSGWLIGDSQTEPTFSTPQPVSDDLTWETVTTFDVGFDASFFEDQLSLTFDYYTRTTSDMLSAGVTLPSTFGATAPERNYGEMQTKGWEVEVGYNHTFDEEAFVNVTATLSDFQEEITRLPDDTKQIPGANTAYHSLYGQYYEGMTLGEIWGYETDGFFTEDDFEQDEDGNLIEDEDGSYIPVDGVPDQSYFEDGGFVYGPGDVKYVDQNGDGEITPGSNTVDEPGDKKVIGNSTPRYQYGIRIDGGWNNFDASVFLQGVGKREFWANGPVFVPGYRPGEAWYEHQLDYWTPDNQDAYYPRPTDHRQQYPAQRNFLPQSKYMMDMSYLRVKNITVGYTLPSDLSSKINIENMRVFVSAENIFEFDNMELPIDPETDYTQAGLNDPNSFGRVYPFRRTISAGLNMTF